jgi:hypothetical protein
MSKANLVKAVKAVSAMCAKHSRITWRIDSEWLRFGNSETCLTMPIHNFGDNPVHEGDSLASFELLMESLGNTIELRSDYAVPNLTMTDWISVEWVSIACDLESMRYQLAGVLFQGRYIVATDGRRLHKAELPYAIVSEDKNDCIVPQKAIEAVSKMLKTFKCDGLRIDFEGHDFIVSSDEFSLRSSMACGRFPNWRMVIPNDKTNYHKVSFSQSSEDYCQKTIKRTKLENKVELAKLPLKQRKEFEHKQASVEFTSIDGEVELSLDPQFVLDAVSMRRSSATVIGLFWRETEPVVIGEGSMVAVIMPMAGDRPKKSKHETATA